MSDGSSKRALTKLGRSRRDFLENTAMTAAATTVGLMPGLRASAASPKALLADAAPASCPAEFRARGEAIVASLPTDVNPPEARVTMGRMILGKQVYAAERDHRLCERARTRKT
jgi:hypothetical protein